MTMQNNIDIVRRNIGRNVDQPELQFFALKIDNQRPIRIPIAVPAHDREWRTDCLQIIGDRWLANVTQMPNLIRLARKIDNALRQFVVRVGHDQDAQCIHFRTADNADITSAPRKIIRLNPRNPRLVLPRVIQ